MSDEPKPWTIRGVTPEVRNDAVQAAKQSDTNLGDWVARAIRTQLDTDAQAKPHHSDASNSMSDDIIAFARVGFDRLEARLERIDTRLDELINRFGRVERSLADVHVQLAEHSVRMDRMDAGLGRIEHCLELAQAGS